MKRVRHVGPSVPSLDDVVRIHNAEVQQSGDAIGILNRGSLEAALDRAKFGPFEGPGSVLERGGLLLRGICQDHPFADETSGPHLRQPTCSWQEMGSRLKGPRKPSAISCWRWHGSSSILMASWHGSLATSKPLRRAKSNEKVNVPEGDETAGRPLGRNQGPQDAGRGPVHLAETPQGTRHAR